VYYIIKIGRFRVKRFGLFASAFLLAVVTAIGLLQISDPTQAHTAQVAQGSTAQAQSAKPSDPTDAVLDWNAIAQTATVAASAPAPQQFRTLVITHGAIFNAVNAIERRYTPYAVNITAPTGASAAAAAVVAGRRKHQSNHYHKARKRLGKTHLKIQRQRKDWAIKLARCVVASLDILTDLKVR